MPPHRAAHWGVRAQQSETSVGVTDWMAEKGMPPAVRDPPSAAAPRPVATRKFATQQRRAPIQLYRTSPAQRNRNDTWRESRISSAAERRTDIQVVWVGFELQAVQVNSEGLVTALASVSPGDNLFVIPEK